MTGGEPGFITYGGILGETGASNTAKGKVDGGAGTNTPANQGAVTNCPL
ncbi:hypothetical protein [Streptomyces sp. NPDC001828]